MQSSCTRRGSKGHHTTEEACWQALLTGLGVREQLRRGAGLHSHSGVDALTCSFQVAKSRRMCQTLTMALEQAPREALLQLKAPGR